MNDKQKTNIPQFTQFTFVNKECHLDILGLCIGYELIFIFWRKFVLQ